MTVAIIWVLPYSSSDRITTENVNSMSDIPACVSWSAHNNLCNTHKYWGCFTSSTTRNLTGPSACKPQWTNRHAFSRIVLTPPGSQCVAVGPCCYRKEYDTTGYENNCSDSAAVHAVLGVHNDEGQESRSLHLVPAALFSWQIRRAQSVHL